MSERSDELIYIHLPAGSEPPRLESQPCRMVVVVEQDVEADWQSKISRWIVDSGCFYMMAWGKDCSSWDYSVDVANLENFGFGDVPDSNFVMTTWHENEPVEEAFWYSRFAAHHPTIDLQVAYIIHIAEQPRARELLTAYWTELPDDGACVSSPNWHGLINRLKFWKKP